MASNILIVDDIAKNIQVLGSILKKENYAISYATNGSQALDMLEDDDYDIILLDVMMPELNGFEVCRKLKEMPDKKDIPVIFLTARVDKEDITEGFHSGAVDYITKPFNSEELKARVRNHLQLKEAKDEIARQNIALVQQNEQLASLNEELRNSLEKIRTLEGILPICSYCKKIRDDQGYWNQIEEYISNHSEALFSHGLCPDCIEKHYSDDDLD